MPKVPSILKGHTSCLKTARRKRNNFHKKAEELCMTVELVREALHQTLGHPFKAATLLQCPVGVIKQFIEDDPTLQDIIDQYKEDILDLAEDSMRKLLKANNVTATIFALKCHGKSRGWLENPDAPGATADKPIFFAYTEPK